MRLPQLLLSTVSPLRLCLVCLLGANYAYVQAEPESTSPWTWQQDAGTSLALRKGDQTIWRLNFGPELAKPYFDPLALPGGGNLTWIAPPDHVWHYGLWFSWKYINGVNYWEINPKTGKPDGTTRLNKAKVLRADTSGADVQFNFDFHPAGDGDSVMTETVRITIETPRLDGSYAIDWYQVTSASATSDVTLDRTPLPGQPGGKDYGGYGGLSFRAAKDLTDVTVLDSEGLRNMATHRSRARWLDTSGTIHGKPAGVTFFDHPTNPGHPSRSYVALSQLKDGPFTYMNPALLHDAPITLRSGESLTLRYRTLIHTGAADTQALDAEFKRFSHSNATQSEKP